MSLLAFLLLVTTAFLAFNAGHSFLNNNSVSGLIIFVACSLLMGRLFLIDVAKNHAYKKGKQEASK